MHVIKTTVQKDKTLETIKEIQHAYDQLLAAGPIAEEELKTRLVSEQLRLIANGSDSLQLLNNLTYIEKNNLPVDYWSDYYDSLSILKPENLHEVAEHFFKPHKTHWIIVGDINNIESALKLHLPAETTLVNADEIIKGE
jgi:predicted Zn-dependent peptidase